LFPRVSFITTNLTLPSRAVHQGGEAGREDGATRLPSVPVNSEPGNDEVSGRSHGNQVKLSVDSILNVHTWLPDGALTSVAQDFSCEGAGAVYAFVARDAKMEILVS
jgi:hypothetical protein